MDENNDQELLQAEDLQRFVPNVHFEQIPIKNLVSNQEYQRNLSLTHVRRAAESFDLYQINPVKVSRRGGVNYVFNGQHTIEIIAIVSGSRETPVWCMIYDDLDYTHEADVFANQQKFIKPLLPYEIFMANIEAGNDKQLIIKDLVESYGMKIGEGKKPGIICAVATLERIHEKYGFQVLDRVLRLTISTWEGDINSFSMNMMMGIARLIMAYGDQLKDDLFQDRLGRMSVREIIRQSMDRHSGSLGYAETMLMAYNRKTRIHLGLNKLYAKKAKFDDVDEALSETDEMDEIDDDSAEDTEQMSMNNCDYSIN